MEMILLCQLKMIADKSSLSFNRASQKLIIGCFANEFEPGVLHSSVQQTRTPQEFNTIRTELRNSQWLMLCALGICVVSVFIEL